MDTKEIQIVYRNVDELIEPDYNPRKISAKQRDDIKGFLENFGLLFLLTLSFYLLSLKNRLRFLRIRDVEGAEGGANRNERRDDFCFMV